MKIRLVLLALGVIGVIANPVSKQTTVDDNKNPLRLENIESQTKHEESTLNNGDEQKKEEPNNVPEPSTVSDDKKYDEVDIIIEESVVSPTDPPTVTEDSPIPLDEALTPTDDNPVPFDLPLRPIDNSPIPFEFGPRPVDDRPISFGVAPRPMNDSPIPFEVNPPINEGPLPFDIPPRPMEDSIPFDFPTNAMEISLSSNDIVPNLDNDFPFVMDIAPQMSDGFQDDFPINHVPFRHGSLNTIQDEIMETAAGFVPTPLVFKRKQKPRRRFATRRHFRPNPFKRKFHFFSPYYGFYRPSSLRFY